MLCAQTGIGLELRAEGGQVVHTVWHQRNQERMAGRRHAFHSRKRAVGVQCEGLSDSVVGI